MTTLQAEAEARGMVWVECPECHGNGTIPSPDYCGQAWCWKCDEGMGGWAEHPAATQEADEPAA